MTKQRMFVVEARNPDGTLNPSGTPPPFHVASENQLFDLFFDNTDKAVSDWALMETWYNQRGWFIREKTW